MATQAKRCGAKRLSDVFSVHIAEVLLKRQAWVPYQQELDHLSRQVKTGEISYICAAPVPHTFAASLVLASILQLVGGIFACSCVQQASQVMTWAARYNTWLLIKLTPKGVVFSFLFFSQVMPCKAVEIA